MPIPEQIFGWSADPYDPQDEEYKFSQAVYAPGTDIKPVAYNIMPRVKNQLQEGSCVFQAATEAMEAAEICQNSWGTDWGCQPPTYPERGHFYLPFDYLTTGGLASSFWTIDLVTGAE
jgi:C1A family cysteine protease